TPVAWIFTSTSPALGGATSISTISRGFPASNATAARLFMVGSKANGQCSNHNRDHVPRPPGATVDRQTRKLAGNSHAHRPPMTRPKPATTICFDAELPAAKGGITLPSGAQKSAPVEG